MKNHDDGINIVDTIITLAKHLNMEVVAEGIETKEQLEILNNLGCEFGQGYFFSKPLPYNLVENIFKSNYFTKNKLPNKSVNKSRKSFSTNYFPLDAFA